ncbi:MAG: hypothetical protein HY692_04625, partial [Cyanobacteria bacterium NC_groundwater_1444_Ag_S-0.65um_54_12]|nr:hypothetical protein [Cyanobacteria bacterium NC_groundwater_1444_Ag_S-0.65um_54_12]
MSKIDASDDRAVVTRRVSSLFTVRWQGKEYACQVRSRLRKENIKVKIGDRVTLDACAETNMT